MSNQAIIDSKNLLSRTFILIFLFALSFTTANAQEEAKEATAASLYNAGLALLKEKKYAEGYDSMMAAKEKAEADENEKVIKLSMKNGAVAAYSAGNALLKAKDYDGAMKYYASGAELNPKYSSNFIGKGKVMNAQGDKMGAIDSYLMAADIAGENGKQKKVDEAYKRAKSIVGKFFSAKDYENVIASGMKVAEKKAVSSILYYVSRSQIETGKHQEALETANKAIEAGTADGTLEDKYYVAKGLALEGLNKTNEAIAAYKMVKEGDYKEQAEYKIQKLGGK